MLSSREAINIVNKAIPGGTIKAWVVYKNLFLFQVFTLNPYEEDQDPFYSVNMNTGEFLEFSVITDGDISEISSLFLNLDKTGMPNG